MNERPVNEGAGAGAGPDAGSDDGPGGGPDEPLDPSAALKQLDPPADVKPARVPLLPFARRCGTFVDWSLRRSRRRVHDQPIGEDPAAEGCATEPGESGEAAAVEEVGEAGASGEASAIEAASGGEASGTASG